MGILAAADEIVEHSKTSFYILGGGLVAWAVLLSVVGITRPDFPGTGVLARGVMLVSVLLAAGAMATAVITA
jgi:hypothetical protein